MAWTPDREAELRRRWTLGESATEIAKALGQGLTRNAVLGKSWRLKLEDRSPKRAFWTGKKIDRKTPKVFTPSIPKVRRPNDGAMSQAAAAARKRALARPIPFEDTPLLVDVTLARPWIDRAFGQCAYPVSGQGADTWSCCAPVDVGAYCDAHRKIMFVKRTPPKISTDTLRVDKPRRRAAA